MIPTHGDRNHLIMTSYGYFIYIRQIRGEAYD
jgi:hypothetical protein